MHTRNYTNNALLPSINWGLSYPYDVTSFFARNGSSFQLKCSWAQLINYLGTMYTGVLIFNSSQFNFFENYICPWDSAQADTVYSYRIAYPNQWLVDYYNTTNTNYQLNPTVMNDTHTISFTSNASNWYYMVLWGSVNSGAGIAAISTIGTLLSEDLHLPTLR